MYAVCDLMQMVQMCCLILKSASAYQSIQKLAKCLFFLFNMFTHHLPVGWMCCVKNSEIHLFFQCACFAPSQLGWWSMRAFVVDDFRYHIVCSDLKPNPDKAKKTISN